MSSKSKMAQHGYELLKGAVTAVFVLAALQKFTGDWNGALGLPNYAWIIWGIIDAIFAIGLYLRPKLFGNLAGIWGIAIAIVLFFLPSTVVVVPLAWLILGVILSLQAFALARLAEMFE